MNKKCSILNRVTESKKCSIINYSNIELNILQKSTKKCIVTGIDLCMESLDSIYIKTTTLRYIRKYNKSKFVEVCSLLLKNTKPNHTKYETNIISHLVKQVRNRFYSQRYCKDLVYNSKIYHNQYRLGL